MIRLMKETEEDTIKWQDGLCSQRGRINTVKMSILPKIIYRWNATLSKFYCIFHRNIKNNPKIHVELQKILNIQKNLEKE